MSGAPRVAPAVGLPGGGDLVQPFTGGSSIGGSVGVQPGIRGFGQVEPAVLGAYAGGSVVPRNAGGGRDDNEGEEHLGDPTRNRRRRYGGGGGGGGAGGNGEVDLPPTTGLIEACEDFESGLDNWTINDVLLCTHAVDTSRKVSGLQSLLCTLTPDAAGGGVEISRAYTGDIVGVDRLEYQMWTQLSAGVNTGYWDASVVHVSENVVSPYTHWQFTLFYEPVEVTDPASPTLQIRTDSGVVDLGIAALVTGSFTRVTLRVDVSSGAYISLDIDGTSHDLSAYRALSITYSDDLAVFLRFLVGQDPGGGLAYTSNVDDVCLHEVP